MLRHISSTCTQVQGCAAATYTQVIQLRWLASCLAALTRMCWVAPKKKGGVTATPFIVQGISSEPH